VGLKAEKAFGDNFFWILGGIPTPDQNKGFEFFIIPSKVMAENVKRAHRLWLDTPGKNEAAHNDNAVRTVHLPPYASFSGWSIEEFRNRWDLIESKLSE
jgi:hypothetical protein